MKQQSKATTAKPPVENQYDFFGRENKKWMIIGAVVMAIGFILMAGGRSDDPNVFDESQVYSPVRITVAPILILIGLAIEVYAIFRNPVKK